MSDGASIHAPHGRRCAGRGTGSVGDLVGRDTRHPGQERFYELYQPGGYDIARLTDGLGAAYRGDDVSFKPYACGRPLNAVLDAALALRQMPGFGPDQIAEVDLALHPASYADKFEAGAQKRRPSQIVEAQFALPFLVATALLRGKVGITEVAAFTDPEVWHWPPASPAGLLPATAAGGK